MREATLSVLDFLDLLGHCFDIVPVKRSEWREMKGPAVLVAAFIGVLFGILLAGAGWGLLSGDGTTAMRAGGGIVLGAGLALLANVAVGVTSFLRS